MAEPLPSKQVVEGSIPFSRSTRRPSRPGVTGRGHADAALEGGRRGYHSMCGSKDGHLSYATSPLHTTCPASVSAQMRAALELIAV